MSDAVHLQSPAIFQSFSVRRIGMILVELPVLYVTDAGFTGMGLGFAGFGSGFGVVTHPPRK
jgi:hypothetical protein